MADVASGDTGGLSVPVGLARDQRVGAPRGNCRYEFVDFVDKLSATRGKSKLWSCLCMPAYPYKPLSVLEL